MPSLEIKELIIQLEINIVEIVLFVPMDFFKLQALLLLVQLKNLLMNLVKQRDYLFMLSINAV
ncbi:hypothetical protein OA58_19465 [Microcystis aeruginosa NIES-88]|nr:hypothetical protein OA58_19465 [Microcystis aeruginosa NIES-88]